MKFNRLGSFTLGVIVTAVSVAGVSIVNASTAKTIKACADKKSGVMRYITKGKCKKSERTLTWNQMGPQGVPGPQGSQGPIGPEGSQGVSTQSGQNFHVIDTAGRDLGISVGVDAFVHTASFIGADGGLWGVSSADDFPYGGISDLRFYSDVNCTEPLATSLPISQPTKRGWNEDRSNPRYFKEKGEPFLSSSRVIYGFVATETGVGKEVIYTCTASTSQEFTSYFENIPEYLVELTEISPPEYSAPFNLVLK